MFPLLQVTNVRPIGQLLIKMKESITDCKFRTNGSVFIYFTRADKG